MFAYPVLIFYNWYVSKSLGTGLSVLCLVVVEFDLSVRLWNMDF